MKNSGQFTGILLVILIAGSTNLNAQRGMRGKMDSTRMQRPGREYYLGQKIDSSLICDSLLFRGMRHAYRPGTGKGYMHGREFVHAPRNRNMHGRGFAAGPMHGNRNGIPPMKAGMTGRGFGYEGRIGIPQFPGAGRVENLPSLNDKQKKEIIDLRQNQTTEMKKLREDMMARIQVLREEHRKNILNILTDEQKKQVETGTGDTKANALK